MYLRPAFFLILSFYILLDTLPLSIHAQEVTQEWVASYNGIGYRTDIGWNIAFDQAGFLYVTGLTCVQQSHCDIALLKYNQQGDLVWIVTQDGLLSADDAARSIAIDSQCNIYISGHCDYPDQTNYITMKFDSTGQELWTAIYDGLAGGGDLAYDLKLDNQNNCYVTGVSYGLTGATDIATIKYDSSGNELWVARYNGPGNWHDHGWELEVDSQGNVYVVGDSWGDTTSTDITLLKYNSLGEEIWGARYCVTDSSSDWALDLVLEGDDYIYVTGKSEEHPTDCDLIVLKYDSSGVELWHSIYACAGDATDLGECITIDSAGDIIVGGYSWGIDSEYDFLIAKYDTAGHELWATTYDGPDHNKDLLALMEVDSDGNIYATGTFDAYANLIYGDYGTLKINPSGELQWAISYEGEGFSKDCAHAMTFGPDGAVYVTGESFGNGTISDIVTIKYTETTGIADENPSATGVQFFSLFPPSPNPFNSATMLRYQLPMAGDINLSVYDISGRLVTELVDRELPAGRYAIPFDGSNLASGVYVYQIITDRFQDSGKMVLLK